MLTVYDKAKRHSESSDRPVHWMAEFSVALPAAQRGDTFDDWRLRLDDPTAVAAQLEALAAARIQASHRHARTCVCIACRVRRNDELLDAIRAAAAPRRRRAGVVNADTEPERHAPSAQSGFEESLACGLTEDFATFDARMTAANATRGERS